ILLLHYSFPKIPEQACSAILSGQEHLIDVGDFGGEFFAM
ncbi:hypothetical protein EVA_14849, partial [gut metagenome]